MGTFIGARLQRFRFPVPRSRKAGADCPRAFLLATGAGTARANASDARAVLFLIGAALAIQRACFGYIPVILGCGPLIRRRLP